MPAEPGLAADNAAAVLRSSAPFLSGRVAAEPYVDRSFARRWLSVTLGVILGYPFELDAFPHSHS